MHGRGRGAFHPRLPFRFGDGDDWVKIGPLKIGVDGGVLYGTAYMREPYGRSPSLSTASTIPNTAASSKWMRKT